MTIVVFLVSLLGAMAIGVPVAFALIFCGIALMTYGGIFDTQIVSQRMIAGADTFTLLAIPFFLLARCCPLGQGFLFGRPVSPEELRLT